MYLSLSCLVVVLFPYIARGDVLSAHVGYQVGPAHNQFINFHFHFEQSEKTISPPLPQPIKILNL